MPRIILEHDSREIGAWDLQVEIITIGRSRNNTIAIDSDMVSQSHARIAREDGGFVLEDRGSTNATLVNGEPATRRKLHDGDRISIGEYVFRFYGDIKQAVEDAVPSESSKPERPEPAASYQTGLEHSIAEICAQRPFCSEEDILRTLLDPRYGAIRIGRYKLRAILRRLELKTRLQRYRHYLERRDDKSQRK